MGYYGDNYRRLAVQTESENEGIDQALADKCNAVYTVLTDAVELASMADDLKRFIYYAQNIPNLDFAYATNQAPDLMKVPSKRNIRVIHALLGKISELGELIDAFLCHWENGDHLDMVNLLEELGDDQWYSNILVDEFDMEWEDVLKKNILKLAKKRYPNGFSSEAALNRDLAAEREALES